MCFFWTIGEAQNTAMAIVLTMQKQADIKKHFLYLGL